MMSASPDPCRCCHKAHDGSRRWLLLLQKFFRCFRKHYFCLLHSKQADDLTTSVLVTMQGHEDVSEQARVAAGSSCALTSGCPSCPRWTVLASELPWVPLSCIAFCWERLSGVAYRKCAEQNSSLVFIAKAGSAAGPGLRRYSHHCLVVIRHLGAGDDACLCQNPEREGQLSRRDP